MRCRECYAAGQTSRIHVAASVSTAMAGERFYDEDGRPHDHDPNETITSYRCSHGHEWTQSRTHQCWCGWPSEKGKP